MSFQLPSTITPKTKYQKKVKPRSDTRFYVYVLIDPRTDEPFYVGKGQDNRHLGHVREARLARHNWRNVEKCQRIREILDAGLEVKYHFPVKDVLESVAYDEEKELIRQYGRIDLGTGPLANRNEGGYGGGAHGPEAIRKIREAKQGENNANSVLTEAQVREIHTWNLANPDVPREQKEAHLAGKYGVSTNTIRHVSTGDRWKHIFDEYYEDRIGKAGENNGNSIMTESIVTAIRHEWEQVKGRMLCSLFCEKKASQYSCSVNTIKNILDRNTWRDIPDPYASQYKVFASSGGKLSDEQVLAMRAEWEQVKNSSSLRKFALRKIAEMKEQGLDISETIVKSVINRRTYRHI